MTHGEEIMRGVCSAHDPAEAIARLDAREMIALAGELDRLPESGLPAILRALVTCEAARRWFAAMTCDRGKGAA